jgi:hypothetical protein
MSSKNTDNGWRWWLTHVGIPVGAICATIIASVIATKCHRDSPETVGPQPTPRSEPQISMTDYLKVTAEYEARKEDLRKRTPPFAYTLVPGCSTKWVNYEGKRIWVKDAEGLSCSDNCPVEPLAALIEEDKTHFYEAGSIRAFPPAAPRLEGTVPHECFPPVDGVCSVNVPLAKVGQAVTFEAFGLGGSGEYAYSWAGPDGPAGQHRQVVTSFSTPGIKSLTVRITSNGQNIYKTCEVAVR